MNLRPCPIARAIGIALLASMLAACGGGGGQQLVASDPPPPVVPPPAAPAEPCPAPIAGDCEVGTSGRMLGGRDSAGRLLVKPQVQLALGTDDPAVDPQRARATYTFVAGVDLDGGELDVVRENTLAAPVRVGAGMGSLLRVAGTVVGRIDNAGLVQILPYAVLSGPVVNTGTLESVGGRIAGDLRNDGTVRVLGSINGTDAGNNADFHVGGEFVQGADGRLQMVLPPADSESDFTGRLLVDGGASLAGALELSTYTDAWGPYLDPALKTFHLIHADGGVSGTFDPQRSPGVFFTGTIRYGDHDVWFDLAGISASAAMAASSQASPLTLASAGNVDRALDVAQSAGTPTPDRQRLLATAGRLFRIGDIAQAARALDSLSGDAQAQIASAAFDAATPRQIAYQLDRRARQPGPALWIAPLADGNVAGRDGWLSPGLLLGVHATLGSGARGAALHGTTAQQDSGAGLHLRRIGSGGWYTGADLGYTQRHAVLQRPIDFGAAGRWQARSQRRFDVATLGGELGRTVSWGGARVTPFLRVEHGVLQATRSVEAGATGFELIVAPALQRRVQASTGLRFSRDWRVAGQALRLDAGAGLSRVLVLTGESRAAFTGAPDSSFDLPALRRDTRSWLQFGLSGSAGPRWNWSLYGEQPSDAFRAWRLQLLRDF